jgi:hypothetical protein
MALRTIDQPNVLLATIMHFYAWIRHASAQRYLTSRQTISPSFEPPTRCSPDPSRSRSQSRNTSDFY